MEIGIAYYATVSILSVTAIVRSNTSSSSSSRRNSIDDTSLDLYEAGGSHVAASEHHDDPLYNIAPLSSPYRSSHFSEEDYLEFAIDYDYDYDDEDDDEYEDHHPSHHHDDEPAIIISPPSNKPSPFSNTFSHTRFTEHLHIPPSPSPISPRTIPSVPLVPSIPASVVHHDTSDTLSECSTVCGSEVEVEYNTLEYHLHRKLSLASVPKVRKVSRNSIIVKDRVATFEQKTAESRMGSLRLSRGRALTWGH